MNKEGEGLEMYNGIIEALLDLQQRVKELEDYNEKKKGK